MTVDERVVSSSPPVGRPGVHTGRPWPGLAARWLKVRREVFALLGRFRVEWTPRVLDVCGFTLIIIAIGLAFGLAPAVAAVGVVLLLIGWAVA